MPAPAERPEATPKFECRLYRPGDDEGLVSLLERAFDGWPAVETSAAPIDHLRWKVRAESDPPPVLSVVEADAKIVGASLTMRQSFRVYGRILPGRQGTDFAADPDYRGLGIGRELLAFDLREFPAHFAFELHIGSRSRHPAMSTIRRQVYDTSVPLAHEVDVLMAPLTGPPPNAGGRSAWSITDATQFDDRIGPLFQAASTPFDLIVVRTKDYLNWRYADPRAGHFRICLAESEGRLLGYAVLTSMRRHGYIADLLTLPGRVDVAESLLREALVTFRKADLQSARCWAPHGHPYLGALRRSGFTERKQPRHVTYRALRNPERAHVLSQPEARVHLMIGDSDNV